jgi:hypothetical protein
MKDRHWKAKGALLQLFISNTPPKGNFIKWKTDWLLKEYDVQNTLKNSLFHIKGSLNTSDIIQKLPILCKPTCVSAEDSALCTHEFGTRWS